MSNPPVRRPMYLKVTLSILTGTLLPVIPISPIQAQTITPTPAADTLVVNSTSDDPVTCTADGILCLRNAIDQSSQRTSPTIITFGIDGTFIVDTPFDIGSDTISTTLTIDGGSKNIIIDGHQKNRIFLVHKMVTATLHNLTLQNGDFDLVPRPPATSGGAIYNQGTLTVSHCILSNNITLGRIPYDQAEELGGYGGAIDNTGILSIDNSVLANNTATYGGALYNTGTLIITNSAIVNNKTVNPYGTGAFSARGNTAGGGIDNQGHLSVGNTTIFGNLAWSGGGIFTNDAATVYNSTIAGNTATAVGGGISIFLNLQLFSSIVAANYLQLDVPQHIRPGNYPTPVPAGLDIYGKVSSLGFNLIGDPNHASGFIASDLVGINDAGLLGNVTSDDGMTPVLRLRNGSAAVGHGYCGGDASIDPPIPAVLTDQNHVPRNNPCTIGAFEMVVSDPTGKATPVPTQIPPG